MDRGDLSAGWKAYALTGRPDFLNYLRRGDVTWSDLWAFYREQPADSAAVVRLMGLFHLFLSQEYEAAGSVLDPDGAVCARLREWARLAVDCDEFVPEEKLQDSLGNLLSQSLISPLYYEAVFNVYLEACLERQARTWSPGDLGGSVPFVAAPPPDSDRKLSIRLPSLPPSRDPSRAEEWRALLSSTMDRHYLAWNRAYSLALGEEDEEWQDEGTGG